MSQNNDERPSANTVSAHLDIFGKVQGVFFRSSLKKVAEEFSVKGWSRNLADGSVVALLQGEERALRRVIDWCRVGPNDAVVESVKVTLLDSSAVFQDFVILLQGCRLEGPT